MQEKKNKKVRNHWKFNPKSYKKEKLLHNNLNSKVKKSKKINSNQFRNKFRDQFGMEEYENSQKSKSCTHERLLFNCLSASFITTQRQRDTQASIIQGEMKVCFCDSVWRRRGERKKKKKKIEKKEERKKTSKKERRKEKNVEERKKKEGVEEERSGPKRKKRKVEVKEKRMF